jgi:hypothetical protein
MPTPLPKLVFRRQAEPRENAFTLLVPEGWSVEGGIFRISPLTQSVQSTSAKVDMTLKGDAAGSVMVRFLPSMYYWDPRRSGGMMGMLTPMGSNYRGMPVYPVMPPPQFLAQIVFPYVHQGQPISQVEMVEQRDRPDLVQAYLTSTQQTPPPGVTFAGGEVIFRYTEGQTVYREQALVVIQDLGPSAIGMWCNLNAWIMRAPEPEFEAWTPVFLAIQGSLQPNPAWQQEERRAQQIASNILAETQQAQQMRAQRARAFQREMQASAHEMVEHRRATNAEIRNEHYLSLTNQQEYVNPYSGQVDLASNQWTHRWVTSDGREFYTDHEGDNPNTDPNLSQFEWQRTPVRPR